MSSCLNMSSSPPLASLVSGQLNGLFSLARFLHRYEFLVQVFWISRAPPIKRPQNKEPHKCANSKIEMSLILIGGELHHK